MWRFLSELPQAKSREEIRAQSLEGWEPWQQPWNRSEEPDIVVPGAEDSISLRHTQAYWVKHEGRVMKFAVDYLESGARRFFIPAKPTEKGAFEARTPRYEGFWRSSLDTDHELPWPQADAAWPHRSAFLQAFDSVEAKAQRISYRGISTCRLCGIGNGSDSLRLDIWEWPEGFRHYVLDHQVRPSPEFELFVMGWKEAL